MKQETESLRIGDMVVTPRGVGLLVGRTSPVRHEVQFGADGPTSYWQRSVLRRATIQEIHDAGLDGVGCNQANDQ